MRASTRFEARSTVRRLVETHIIYTSELCRHETRGIPIDDKEQELEILKVCQHSRSNAN